MNLQLLTDSELFCNNVIGQLLEQTPDAVPSFSPLNNVSFSVKPYQSYVNTIVQAQIAAMKGNITGLQQLASKGVDLNKANYDLRTPLHYAAKAGSLNTVKYLLSRGVILNPVDRWNATPMSYARPYQPLYQFFKNLSAIDGEQDTNYYSLESVYQNSQLSTDDYRAFYAAYYNDLQALQTL